MSVSDTSDLEQRLARQAERAKQADDASVGEVIEYLKAYAKQETLGPLKGAGNWLGYGFAAASGNLSWLAYLIVLVVACVLLGLTLMRIKKSTLHKEPK
jgi:hypothetical protein